MPLASASPVSGLVGHMSVIQAAEYWMMLIPCYRTDEVIKASVMLNDTLTDPKSAMSTSADQSAFYRAHGVSVFEFYDTVSNSSFFASLYG